MDTLDITVIEETKDYGMFDKHICNRDIEEDHVLKLIESIREKNQLRAHPILVDNDGIIIDGQHRLEAARRLGIPIPYYIDKSANVDDIIRLNVNQKAWQLPQYYNFYCKREYPEYLKLKNFIDAEKIPLNIGVLLLNGEKSGEFFTRFKKGKYRFPNEVEYMDAMQKKEHIKQVIDFIKKKTSGNKTYLDRVTFYSALIEFYNIKSFSHEIFMHKLELKLNIMCSRTRQSDYVSLFKEIYNYRSTKNNRLDCTDEDTGT